MCACHSLEIILFQALEGMCPCFAFCVFAPAQSKLRTQPYIIDQAAKIACKLLRGICQETVGFVLHDVAHASCIHTQDRHT